MSLLLDTHTLLWHVEGRDELGLDARGAIESAAQTGNIAVSAVSFWEVAMLLERGRIRLGQSADL